MEKRENAKGLKKYTAGGALGLLVGIATEIGQKYLSTEWNFLANSGAVWLIAAYFAACLGKCNGRQSVFVCTICLLCCVGGQYGFEAIQSKISIRFLLGFI